MPKSRRLLKSVPSPVHPSGVPSPVHPTTVDLSLTHKSVETIELSHEATQIIETLRVRHNISKSSSVSCAIESFYRLLSHGECPFCHMPATRIHDSKELGLVWTCFEGCNP